MIEIYLPTLINIRIENYSLYEQRPSFSYEFINGINLIIGGNGVGKTTFLNIIKYGLIGAYHSDEIVRVYNYNKITKRRQLNKYFFKNRMAPSYEKNEEAKVILKFKINNTTFQVTRSLFEHKLIEVLVLENDKEYSLTGETIAQHLYENLDNKEKEKNNYLQYNYELKIKDLSNLNSFEDFIFFINEVMFFGENRKTLLWDIENQNRLAVNYFITAGLNEEYNKSRLDAKYYDSMSRHKSEEAKAIKRLLKKIEQEQKKSLSKDFIVLRNQIEQIKENIIHQKNKIGKYMKNIRYIELKLKSKFSDRTNINKQIIDLETTVQQEESKLFQSMWQTLHPLYNEFLQNMKCNHLCPLCNKDLNNDHILISSLNENKCMLCANDIADTKLESNEIQILKKDLELLLLQRNSLEKDIVSYQKEIYMDDQDKTKCEDILFNLQSQLRELEYKVNIEQENVDPNSLSYNIMLQQISDLEKEKNELKLISDKHNNRASEITKTMDYERKNINNSLSHIFTRFAENFIGVNSYLTYSNLDDKGNRYIPIIDNIARLDEEELSESQRFFIDHSFRMSILNFFYNNPTFFICETPDSSLDISYELNAASIFLEYLNKPNSLILTSNLNNSEFLEHIIDQSSDIKYINLLEYGRVSAIQNESARLKNISTKIKERIDEKQRNS